MNQSSSSSSTYDSTSLEGQYTSMKRSLFHNFIKLVIFSYLVIVMIELVQLVWIKQYDKLIKLPLPVILLFYSVKYSHSFNGKHDMVCLALFMIWTGTNFYNNFHNGNVVENYFGTPVDSYYFAHATTLVGRIFAQKIPNITQKVIFGVIITITRVLIIEPTKPAIYAREAIVLGLILYIDMTQEKYEKDLFFQYSNYKNQLTKFRDLVVQDIPDGIAIVSLDLNRSLFMNTSFKISRKENHTQEIRDYLLEFIIHETGSEGSQIMRNSQVLASQSTTFYQYLKENFDNESIAMHTKLSCNLIHHQKSDNNEVNTPCLFETKAFPIVWNGESAIAIIMHDITQQQTILGLQLADAHKDTMLATISHELRTPLNGILGMIQIMEKRVQDKDMLKNLSICKNSGSLLMGLVNSILDLNQIRSNKLQLNITRFDLNEFLKDIIQMFEFQCTQKKLQLNLRVKSLPTSYFITTDKERLSQIFINLLGNALKFTLKGSITISVDAVSQPNYVKFSIKDTGIGIQEEDKSKLFKIFGRAEHYNQSLNRHGVGLGLTISNNLVKILSESNKSQNITMKSIYGEGTKFSFMIKAVLQKSMMATRHRTSECSVNVRETHSYIDDLHEKMENHKTMSINNYKVFQQRFETEKSRITDVSTRPCNLETQGDILIVDDNPFNLIVAEQLVTSHGYKVKTVLSGQAAIQEIQTSAHKGEHIRLIFMDCQMPVMDGYETSKMLKDMMNKKEIPDIPIIALTANSSDLDKKKSIKAGMCHHLTKPLKDAELGAVLGQFLGRHGA